MSERFSKRLQTFVEKDVVSLLTRTAIGLEKEGLRVDRDGYLSQTPHPEIFGSPLTNPHITTDYSEALMEMITPPCNSVDEVIDYLADIHTFVTRGLDDELLWNASMPCKIKGEAYIPLAQYGSSNAGTMKTVYRRGLGYRYGRTMQVIAGIHFNHSFCHSFWEHYQQIEGDQQILQDFITERSFGLLRNLQRIGWLIPYLFGASPAVCKSFLNGKSSTLESWNEDTFYHPYATSLRMGDIGYQNNRENEIGVKACYDNLEEYIGAITYAIETSYPGYEKIGVKVDGEYRQLNSNILQIENEYYSTVRPKQPLIGNEKPTRALRARGVKYVELRSIDINPFSPIGIEPEQLYLLELLFIESLLECSPPISPWERAEIDKNEMLVAQMGRKPGLMLKRNGEEILLKTWAHEMLDSLMQVAELIDQQQQTNRYCECVEKARAMVDDPEKTPSARALREMSEAGIGYFEYTQQQSQDSMKNSIARQLEPDNEHTLIDTTRESVKARQRIEAADSCTFDEYLENYFSQ